MDYSLSLIFKLLRVEALLFLGCMVCFFWGRFFSQTKEIEVKIRWVLDGFFCVLILLAWVQCQSSETFHFGGWLSLTSLQCWCRLLILIYGLGCLRFLFQISSWYEMGLYFKIMGIFCLSFILIGGKAQALVLALACLPLFFLSSSVRSSVRKTLFFALTLIPAFSILTFMPKDSQLGLLAQAVPTLISLGFGIWIISQGQRARDQGLEVWFFLNHGFLIFTASTCFCLFVQSESLAHLNQELAMILQLTLFWLVCVYGFQALVLPKMSFHGLSMLIPLCFLLLFFAQNPTDQVLGLVTQLSVPMLLLHLYLLEKRESHDPLESRILVLHLLVLGFVLPLQGVLKILDPKINAVLAILAAIIAIAGLSQRWKIKLQQETSWKSPLLLLWIVSLSLMPALQRTGIKLHAEIEKDYQKEILIIESEQF